MIKAIKIQNHRIPWDKIREYFVFFLFCSILVAAAFGWGIIYENRRHEGWRENFIKLENKIRNQDGRLTVLEGRPTTKR